MTADYAELPLFRATDPDTSAAGARHIRPKVGSQIMLLLQVYRDHSIYGLTDEQACTLATLVNGGWKRCSDLRRLGWIEPTGETRPATSGVPQRICRITAAGVEALK